MYSSKNKMYQHFKFTLEVKNKSTEAAFVSRSSTILYYYCNRTSFHQVSNETVWTNVKLLKLQTATNN